MNKIKVCHIITKLELGGAQQNTLFTVEHLDKDRFIPVLISGKGGILDDEASVLDGVKVFFVSNLVRQISPINDVIALFKIWLRLLKEKPQVVHTHSSKAGVLGRWAAFFARVPIIIHTFHGFGFHDKQRFLIRMFYVFLERLTEKVTDKFIAVSSRNIDKGIKSNIGNINKYILIRSGIDTVRYKQIDINKEAKRAELELDSDTRIITTIGPFKPQKNLFDLIKVSKSILNNQSNCKILIVGDGKLRSEIERMIAEYGIADKIKLLGWRRDIGEILAISDIFLLTSSWEGLPRSAIEAMCVGLPVVANDVDGVREVVKNEETGFLFKPHSIEEMASKIVELLSNRVLADTIGQNAKNAIGKQYDINYMVKQQEDLYSNMMD